MIYLSKPIGGAPRYVAEHLHYRRVPVWWASRTGKVVDLQQVEPNDVPYKVRRQIAKQRHRTTRHFKGA
jgi:hypothetical protein